MRKKCPNCRHIKKEVETRKGNHPAAAAAVELCHFCLSIQSVAKFIPRKEFLNFMYDGGSTEQQHRQLVLTVLARNTAKLVRVTSSTRPNNDNNDEVGEEKTDDGMRIVVNDGDVVSICWYQTGNSSTSSKDLEPLIQFRVVKCVEAADSILTDDGNAAVQEKHTEKTSILEGESKTDSVFSTESRPNTNSVNDKKEADFVSMRNEEDRGDKNNENDSQESQESSEEEESAPLSLPSKFLASTSKSYSFDSQLLSASPSKAILHAATDTIAYSQKRKTPPQMGDETNSSFTTSKTPKKSNVQEASHGGSDRAANTDTAALSSLSYDQLVQIRAQSTTTSLRHNVLSLALALGSNASAYDSNFLKEIQDFRTPAKVRQNHAGDEGSGKMRSDSMKSAPAKVETRQWMPRLLQGTEIILNSKNSNDTK